MKSFCVLALIALVSSALADVGDKELLEGICSRDNSVPVVRDVAVVKSFIHLLDTDRSVKCENNIAQAIRSLGPAIDATEVCSHEAEQIKQSIWENYIAVAPDQISDLPSQLGVFFMSTIDKRC